MIKKSLAAITGLMLTVLTYASNEQAHWITAFENQSASNTWICFRKDMLIDSLPQEDIHLKIAADSKYWMWINGRLAVFEGSVKRGPNPSDTYYDEVDISSFLKEGNNSIAILLWYFGKEGFSYQPSGKAGLYVKSLSGSLSLNTDKQWLSTLHPGYYTPAGTQPNFRLSESNIGYDARIFPEDWIIRPTGNLTYPWAPAIEVGTEGSAPWNKLYPRIIPLWKDYGKKEYPDSQWYRGNEVDTLICRLPYNMQLTPCIELEAPEGKVITMYTDDYKGGGVYNLRGEYITKGGQQSYESLGWINGHSVYYLIPKGVEVLKTEYRETSYDTSFAGTFNCNDDFFNRLWQKAQRTLLVTMRDTYMDCPDRERAQWWGDEVIESGESFYALCPKSHLLMKKGMYELMGWQQDNGIIFSPIPSSNYHTELPGQMLASIGRYGFWNYYLNTGDRIPVEDLYDAVKRYLHVWQYNPDGTIKFRSGDWTWGDWGTNIDIEGLFNAWYYLALEGTAQMAEVLDKKEDATNLKEEMRLLKDAFNQAYWNGAAYKANSTIPHPDDRLQALAVVSGLADESKYEAIRNLFRKYEYASPYMEKYVLEALFVMNQPEEALARMKKRFESMVNHPTLTTLFEGWGLGLQGFGGGTYNHAWSGGGLTLLSQYVCGVSPVKPGFKEFSVFPQMGNLIHAETSLLTVNGRISISLERTDGRIQMHLTVPENTQALLPIKPEIKRIEVNGRSVYKNGKFRSNKYCRPEYSSTNQIAIKVSSGVWKVTMSQ